MKLIDDWRDAWRFYSVWGAAVLAVLGGVVSLLERFGPGLLSPFWLGILMSVLGALIIIGRVLSQVAPLVSKQLDERKTQGA